MSSPNAQSLRLSDKNLPKLTTLPTKCRGAGFFFLSFFEICLELKESKRIFLSMELKISRRVDAAHYLLAWRF